MSHSHTLPVRSLIYCFVLGAVFILLLFFQKGTGTQIASDYTVYVDFNWPSADAIQLEKEVTAKFEAAILGLEGVQHIYSSTSNGHGQITVMFSADQNLSRKRYEVSALLHQIHKKMPSGVSFPLVWLNQFHEDERNLISEYYLVTDDDCSFSRFCKETVIPKLLKVEGVSDVEISDLNDCKACLTISSEKAELLGITTQEMRAALERMQRDYPLGFLQGANSRLPIIIRGGDVGSHEIMNIPIKKIGRRLVLFRDFSSLSIIPSSPISTLRYNGQPAHRLRIFGKDRAVVNGIESLINSIFESDNRPVSVALKELSNSSTEKVQCPPVIWLVSCSIVIIFLLFSSISYLAVNVWLYFAGGGFLLLLLWVYPLNTGDFFFTGAILSFVLFLSGRARPSKSIAIDQGMCMLLGISFFAVTAIFYFSLESDDQEYAGLAVVSGALTAFSFFSVALFSNDLHAAFGIVNINHNKSYIHGIEAIAKMSVKLAAFMNRFRWCLIAAMLFLFGLPVFLLPTRMQGQDIIAKWYNEMVAPVLNEEAKQILNTYVGGALYRFYSREATVLTTSEHQTDRMLTMEIKLARGVSKRMLSEAVFQMENIIRGCRQVSFFETSLIGTDEAVIRVKFKTEYAREAYLVQLKQQMELAAGKILYCSVTIVGAGKPFSNEIIIPTNAQSVILNGYKYDELLSIANRVKRLLESTPRVLNVRLDNYESGDEKGNSYSRYFRVVNKYDLELYGLRSGFFRDDLKGSVIGKVEYEGQHLPLEVEKEQVRNDGIWKVLNKPQYSDSATFRRLKDYIEESVGNAHFRIDRRDQNYQIEVGYTVEGNKFQEGVIKDSILRKTREILPRGFRILKSSSGASVKSTPFSLFRIICTVIAALVFLWSIYCGGKIDIFRLSVLLLFSFTGVFLTTRWITYDFERGGYWALVLLVIYTLYAGWKLRRSLGNKPGIGRTLRYYHELLSFLWNKRTLLFIGVGIAGICLLPRSSFLFSFFTTFAGGIGFLLLGVYFMIPWLCFHAVRSK